MHQRTTSLDGSAPGVFEAARCAGGVVQSEFYQLRRTAIMDISAYCAFLVGFIGSAPFAWQFLSAQLESGEFVRGLWHFFALVAISGLLCGIAGLALGMIGGWLWEQNHRRRRRKLDASRTIAVESSTGRDAGGAAKNEEEMTREDSEAAPFLRLVPERAPSIPELSERKLTSIRFFSDGIELDFSGVIVVTTDGPVVVSGLQRFRYPDAGSRDALCSLIGSSVDAIRAAPSERIEIRFSGDRHLIVQHARSGSVTILNRS